ncbi:MAG TPA: IPT/TIG domain-containing protein [Longimicrobium sp.]
MLFHNRGRLGALARLTVLLCLPVAAAACSDRATLPEIKVPEGSLAVLECRASVAGASLECGDPSQAGGARLDRQTVGQQGKYVRLVSSRVSYADGVFSFDVTVQNLANLPMGTGDGSTRHDDGVRVLFSSGPTVTAGNGTITVLNASGTDAFTASEQPYFQYGGRVGGVDQDELGPDGVLAPGEVSAARTWRLGMPAGVEAFSFLVFVSTETPPGTLSSAAPQVTGVSPLPLVPGRTATLTGTSFDPASASVTIGGAAAPVVGGDAGSLQVTVPCVLSGNVAVSVTSGGMRGAAVTHPLQVPRHTLAVGQTAIVTDSARVGCNELAPSGTDSRYLVAVYNTHDWSYSSAGIEFSGDAVGVASTAQRAPAPRPSVAAPSFAPISGAAQRSLEELAQQGDDPHLRVLEATRREFERLRNRFPSDARLRASRNAVPAGVTPPPPTRVMKMLDLSSGWCGDFLTVNATRVYYSGKLAIYEDDETPTEFKAANNAKMREYYQRIGDEYNADMEPIIRTHFGDPIRRDAMTDNNGVLVALFTPKLNNTGVAGFVSPCDYFPEDEYNKATNFGEYFYARLPTFNGTGYWGVYSPDTWYWNMRSTFIHETKHVASLAARRVYNSAWEWPWLEEGTARHAEELWARNVVYNVPWKGNTGYGGPDALGSVYCDVRPDWQPCSATDPRRPSVNMWRHFQMLYQGFMTTPHVNSAFGRTNDESPGLSSAFYATAWSLVRYTIDRYAASDAAFLTALTNTQDYHLENLAKRAGVSIDQLLGEWALAMYADDRFGLTNRDLDFPTWNLPSMWAGLKKDFGWPYMLDSPLVPHQLAFGPVAPVEVPNLHAGAVKYFEFTGTHTQPQLLRVRGIAGDTLQNRVRIAVARLQ